MVVQHIFFNKQKRAGALLSAAMADEALYDGVIDTLVDFGYRLEFVFGGGAGLYCPHILATQALDTPQKNAIFTQAFLEQYDRNAFPAKICINRTLPRAQQMNVLLHELMHFYQDIHGFYYAPLQEEGVFPILPDARSRVVLTLFNECWAACEAVRAGWRLKNLGDDLAWRGALASRDWADLARGYADNMAGGMDEGRAALAMIEQWYEAPQRAFYEREALAFFTQNIAQYTSTGASVEPDNLRKIRLEDLIARMPDDGVLSYFRAMDVENPLFFEIRTPMVRDAVESFEGEYGGAQNTNIQDIKCATPPYLWHRVYSNEIATSEIPPDAFAQAQAGSTKF